MSTRFTWVSQAIRFVLTMPQEHFWLAPTFRSTPVRYVCGHHNHWMVYFAERTPARVRIDAVCFQNGPILYRIPLTFHYATILYCNLPLETVQSQVIYHRIMKRAMIDQCLGGCKDLGEYVGTFL